MKKVSIIIPIYNSEKTIGTCLDSLLGQTYKNIEIIVVDDGSSDASVSKCESYSKKDARIVIIKQRHEGPSSARNKALRKATGELVFFCDSDDYISNNAIEELVNLTNEHAIARLPLVEVSGDCAKNKNKSGAKIRRSKYIKRILKRKTIGGVSGALFEKEKIKSNFDENTSLMEDTIFLIEYLIGGGIEEIIFTPTSYYYYVKNNQSLTNNHSNINWIITNYFYSLNTISTVAGKKYKRLIENEKCEILENELCASGNMNKSSMDKKIKLYSGAKIHMTVFSALYILGLKKWCINYFKLKRLIRKYM